MKPFLLALLFAGTVLFRGSAADEAKTDLSRVVHIDLELTLEQYKQVRMEQFKTEMQVKVLETDEGPGEEMRKRQRQLLKERSQKLQSMADELRAKAMRLEKAISEASRKHAEEMSPSESTVAPAGERSLRERMLGTWQLVSFADGRVSEANKGELKFIGERHWSVSRLSPRTGRLDYHMGGTYTLNGDEYVEMIEYGTGGPIGETFTYKLTVEDDKFTQTGVGNPWSLVFKRAK
jgi:hypothetical protein